MWELTGTSEARGAADSMKPGVERSGPEEPLSKLFNAREAADSGIIMNCSFVIATAIGRFAG